MRHQTAQKRDIVLDAVKGKAIQRIGPPARSLIPAIKACSTKDDTHRHAASYVGRMVGYLPGKLASKP